MTRERNYPDTGPEGGRSGLNEAVLGLGWGCLMRSLSASRPVFTT